MKKVIEEMEANLGEMNEWFEHMHCIPELSMREEETAEYLADILRQWDFEVGAGVGKHGNCSLPSSWGWR